MIKKLLLFTLLLLTSLPILNKYEGENFVAKAESKDSEISYKKLDKRAQILALYLASYESPLQYHAQDFVDAATLYGLDWKMLPAIAGVESTFGKAIPGGYNAWGWGVYGNQAVYFNSWRDGIFTIAKGLRENYINRGLSEPYSINKVYASSPQWGWKVSYFMNDLEKFATKYEIQADQKIAAFSGQLDLNTSN